MIELQEDEVDDHDTSTIDEVSFAANLSVASCLKMPKTKQPNKQTNCKTTNKQATKNMETRSKNKLQKNIANQAKQKMQNYTANQPTKQRECKKQRKPSQTI